MQLKNFGPTSRRELEGRLAEVGLSVGMDERQIAQFVRDLHR
jgi:hypothetical protein